MRFRCFLITLVCVSALNAGLNSAVNAHDAAEPRRQALDEALESAPGDVMLFLSRGITSREQGHWDAALEDFCKAAELSPTIGVAQILMAATLQDSGHPHRAIKLLTEVLAADPGNSDALLERARSYRAQGEWLDAAADLGTAISLMDPLVPEVVLARADALQAAGPAHLEQAFATLQQGMDQLGPVVSLLGRLVDLSLQEGRYDDGLMALKRLPDAVAQQPRWLKRRADLFAAAGQTDKARESYIAALNNLSAMPESRRSTRAMAVLQTDLLVLIDLQTKVSLQR